MISFFIIKISTFYNPGESRNVFEKKGVRKKIFENFFCLFKNAKKEFFYCFLERNLLAELCKQRKTEKLEKEKKKTGCYSFTRPLKRHCERVPESPARL